MFSIAIDGPGGAGKSSVAKGVAKKLGFQYLDTGALYRALGYALTVKGVDVEDEAAVRANIDDLTLELAYEEGKQIVLVNGEDMTPFIRTAEAGNGASKVSVHGCVRQKLLDTQRHTADIYNIIMDGRDIGTVVLPHADLKLFVTASPRIRAERRFLELEKAGHPHGSVEEIEKDIAERDYRDSHRAIAPLKQADDAILVDTSDMGLEEVIAKVCEMVEERR